jgi:hypothetical protein
MMQVAKLTKFGAMRVLEGRTGMTFVIKSFSNDVGGNPTVAHVIDYRFDHNGRPQTWSLSFLMGHYECVEDVLP